MIVRRVIRIETSLENYLKEISLPKKVINELVLEKRISLNGEVISLKTMLKKNDIIYFDLNDYDLNDIVPFKKNINIVYEDDEVILVKKDRGILIHSDGNTNETLLNAVSFYLENQGFNNKCRVLHRIDLDTTGLVLFSKNLLSYYFINKQMEDENIKKVYIAIVNGYLEQNNGVLDYSIGRNRHVNNQYIVSKSGKKAYTEYKVLERKNNKTKVEVTIKTGRTHQIRVHCSHIKHSLIGDKIYGNGGKLMLHSYLLGFVHPYTNKYQEFVCKESNEYKL